MYRGYDLTSQVYKRAIKPGLPAGTICTQPNGRKHKILYFMEIALSIYLTTFDMMKGGTSQNLSSFYFHGFMWKL